MSQNAPKMAHKSSPKCTQKPAWDPPQSQTQKKASICYLNGAQREPKMIPKISQGSSWPHYRAHFFAKMEPWNAVLNLDTFLSSIELHSESPDPAFSMVFTSRNAGAPFRRNAGLRSPFGSLLRPEIVNRRPLLNRR